MKSNRDSLPKHVSPHNYNSPQYYAETFTNFLRDSKAPKNKNYVGYRAIQRGERVELELEEYIVDFTFKVKSNSKAVSRLEIKTVNSLPNETLLIVEEISVPLIKAKTGKVSGAHFEGYTTFFNEALKYIKSVKLKQ
ncbi:MAG: hypothetical protein WCX73_01600 [Candidatus Pacearchaeota archaeon]|jgi:hypothetical protein